MIDLPANVNFDPNDDLFTLDQTDDVITSVQAFREGPDFIVELWGRTTLVSPSGNRNVGSEFQQNAVIEFDGHGGFTWRVTRWVFEESHDVDMATRFQAAGTKATVSGHRRY